MTDKGTKTTLRIAAGTAFAGLALVLAGAGRAELPQVLVPHAVPVHGAVAGPGGPRGLEPVTAISGPARVQPRRAATPAQTTALVPQGFLGPDFTQPNLEYLGGRVMRSQNTFAFFLEPSDGTPFPAGYKETMIQFLNDVAADSGKTSNIFSANTSLHDGTGPLAYSVHNWKLGGATDSESLSVWAGSVAQRSTCTTPAPCLDEAQVIDEIAFLQWYFNSQAPTSVRTPMPGGYTSVFLLFLPPGVGTCFTSGSTVCSDSVFCGYHQFYTYTNAPAVPYVFAVIPYEPATSCSPNTTSAAGALDTLAHEQMEAATDPAWNIPGAGGGGWRQPGPPGHRLESADICESDFGFDISGNPDPAARWTQEINGHPYLVQTEWSNALHGCYQFGAPTITSVLPGSAPVGGTVSITGKNFFTLSKVTFNGVAADVSLGVQDSWTHFTIPVPAGATTGKIRVETGGVQPDVLKNPAQAPSYGAAVSAGSFQVAPTVSSIAPTHGQAGSSVTLNGDNFLGATAVKFNGVAGKLTSVAPDGTSLVATVPDAAKSGPVTVTTKAGTSAPSAQSFLLEPKVKTFSPGSASSNAVVTVTGTGLDSVTAVDFAGHAGVSVEAPGPAPTSLKVKVPADAVAGPLTLHGAAGSVATTTTDFKPLPKLGSITGEPAYVGGTVSVTGSSFLSTATHVFLGKVEVTPDALTATGFHFDVPPSASTGPLKVVTSTGSATSAAPVRIKPTVTVSAPSPAEGFAGTTVSLQGAALTGATKVTVGGVAAMFKVVDNTHVTLTVPAAAVTGPVVVSNAYGSGAWDTFTVDPKITRFSPTSGAVGTMVTISGTGLAGAIGVTFNGLASGGVTPVSATQVKATVPAGATAGPVVVTTASPTPSTPFGTFTPTFSATGITPVAGVGDDVAVTGLGLTGVTLVTFTGSVTPVTAVPTSNDGTTLHVTVPAGAATGPVTVRKGPPGPSAVTIPVPTSFTLLSLATYTPHAADVGATVTINGSGFLGATGVSFGGIAAATPAINLAGTQIVATVPSGYTSGDIVVTAISGKTLTISFGRLAITGFSPAAAGPGGAVTIEGVGFTGATSVTFNGTAATIDGGGDDTHVLTHVPLLATSGPVVVTTPSGTASRSFTLLAGVVLNEVAPAITGGQDLVELRVTSAGSLSGVALVQGNGTSTPTTLAVLPALNVTAGDLVVVHLNPAAGVTDEASLTGCADALCYAGAYDVRGISTTSITFSSRVLALFAPGSTSSSWTILDAVPFVTATTPTAAFLTDLATIQSVGEWATCAGACDTTTGAAVSVDWSGAGTTSTGMTLQRGSGDTNGKADWTVAVGTFGAANP